MAPDNIKLVKGLQGQTVGIIGPSGAGKSTLVDILIGLLPPTRGKVVIDGESLNTKNSSGWMNLLGYVSQTPYIYDGSLAENVAFGVDNGGIDSSRVSECCSMAAMDFLNDLPLVDLASNHTITLAECGKIYSPEWEASVGTATLCSASIVKNKI